MQKAAGEIVAILTERMHALGATREMACEVSGTLIAAAWMMQKLWEGDKARPSFVAMLGDQRIGLDLEPLVRPCFASPLC